jgi:hypothetical protein
MAFTILASASGAPGVTTAALGLALHWPGDVLLADCDRTPSHTVLSGVLRGTDAGGRGLTALAAAHRSGTDLSIELPSQCLPLMAESTQSRGRDTDEFQAVRRSFLPGFNHPGSADLFNAIWPDFVSALDLLERAGHTVIVDLGRVGKAMPTALVTSARRILLVTRSSLRALGALQLHLESVKSQLGAAPGNCELGLVVVGPGRPYSTGEISSALGVPVVATLPWAPSATDEFLDGEKCERALKRAFESWAAALHSADQQRRRQVGSRILVGAGTASQGNQAPGGGDA